MITVAQKVEEIVLNSPYLREGMSENLINLSALARKIKPVIETSLYKKVTEGAVLIALQRYSKTMKPYSQVNPSKYLANLSLRAGLFELTVTNSVLLSKKLFEFSKYTQTRKGVILIITKEKYKTTIISYD